MKYISNVAAIACCAIVTVGMTGCGGSSGGSSSVDGTTCTVPADVKAAATLDENTTRNAVKATLAIDEINYMIVGPGPASTQKSTQKVSVSTLASSIGGRVQGLQKSTSSVKKLISEDRVEYGDDLPCDSGTYTFHESDTESEVDGEGTGIGEFTLSFNECVLADTEENWNKISFFLDYTQYDSVLDNMMDRDVVSSVYTFNGSVTRSYNEEYSYSDESWDDRQVPLDNGYSYGDTTDGTAAYATNGLSVEYKADGMVRELFTSTENLSVTFNNSYSSFYNQSYENLEALYDGNYTNENGSTYQSSWSATFDGTESYKTFGETNTTVSFNACNLSLEGESSSSYSNAYVYEDDFYQYSEWKEKYSRSSKVSGYVTMVDGEDSLDLYADGLTVSLDRNYTSGNEYSVSEMMSLNGTVGSTGLGGSVVLDTQSPWLISSEYPDNRMNPEQIYIDNYFYVYYSPYAGKTVLTGTNSAAIEFMKDDQNITYGTITIGDGEPVEYDNIEEMDIGIYID